MIINSILIAVLVIAFTVCAVKNEKKQELLRQELLTIKKRYEVIDRRETAREEMEKRQLRRVLELENILYNAGNELEDDEDDE